MTPEDRPSDRTAPADTETPHTATQHTEPVDAEIVEAVEAVPPSDVAITNTGPGGIVDPSLPQAPVLPTGYTDAGVPTLDYVRDKIEGRSATAMGWEELRTAEVEEAEQKFAEREQKGKDKLAEIRRQMGL